MIICDTGPFVAAAIATDVNHRPCVDLFASLHLADVECLVPGPVVAEVGYLLQQRADSDTEAAFLEALADGDFTCVNPTEDDFGRMAHLVRQYADLGLGTTDACVIAMAERLRIPEVATLDRRHFTVVRPSHVSALALLPDRISV